MSDFDCSRLDCFDEELTAPREELNRIARDISIADIQKVASGELPLETKRTQLTGLVEILQGTGRDDIRAYAQGILKLIEADGPDFEIPQITS